MRAVLIALLASLSFVPATGGAQWRASDVPPEPRLYDSPWGDFPLERLEPGARLRLTAADGGRMEARLLALEDGALDLRRSGSVAPARLTFEELGSLHALEVRAAPAWRDRAAKIGMVAGALAGAAVGAARHRPPDETITDRHQPSLSEDMAANASLGMLAGWLTGLHVVGRVRWRPVTLP